MDIFPTTTTKKKHLSDLGKKRESSAFQVRDPAAANGNLFSRFLTPAVGGETPSTSFSTMTPLLAQREKLPLAARWEQGILCGAEETPEGGRRGGHGSGP